MRVLAVDGPSGAGKSTVARAVGAALRERGVAVESVPTDDFATWDDPVSWWPRLVDGVLDPLRRGSPGRYRRTTWDGSVPRLGEWREVPVPDVLVVEGVSSARRSARPSLSLAVWVELAEEMRLERAVARDGESSREQLRRWQAFERGWFAVDGTRAAAGLRVASP
ncbi:uridine kinase [Solihabitans fulvus]|uniref:Uridine kinase n=1 Tax=Solihabitans fulvus TaxID=1892852 RepID=A0A5B2XFA7_9PSEU|nr:uridine kinase [Solihabitans fulvus]